MLLQEQDSPTRNFMGKYKFEGGDNAYVHAILPTMEKDIRTVKGEKKLDLVAVNSYRILILVMSKNFPIYSIYSI